MSPPVLSSPRSTLYSKGIVSVILSEQFIVVLSFLKPIFKSLPTAGIVFNKKEITRMRQKKIREPIYKFCFKPLPFWDFKHYVFWTISTKNSFWTKFCKRFINFPFFTQIYSKLSFLLEPQMIQKTSDIRAISNCGYNPFILYNTFQYYVVESFHILFTFNKKRFWIFCND